MNFNFKEIGDIIALLTHIGPHGINCLCINFSQLCDWGLAECYSQNQKLLFHINASFTFDLLRC